MTDDDMRALGYPDGHPAAAAIRAALDGPPASPTREEQT